jgi:hypothetical protein
LTYCCSGASPLPDPFARARARWVDVEQQATVQRSGVPRGSRPSPCRRQLEFVNPRGMLFKQVSQIRRGEWVVEISSNIGVRKR